MDDLYEYEVLGARPRRHIRPPPYYEDYDVTLPRLSHRCDQQRVLIPQVSQSSFNMLPQEEQERLSPEYLTSHLSPYQGPYQTSHSNYELAEIQHESLLNQQSQRRSEEKTVDHVLRTDMLQSINSTRNLPPPPPPTPEYTSCSLAPVKEEEYWPPPPHLPKEKEEVVPVPLLDRLDSLMNELQILKREASAAQQSAYSTPMHQPGPAVASSPLIATSKSVNPEPSRPIHFQTTEHPLQMTSPSFMLRQQHESSRPLPYTFSPDTYYKGPQPSIPKLMHRDPGEFARLKLALENLLPHNSSELFKYQILLDHLHLEEAKLIADAYLYSPTPYSDTMEALNDKLGQPHQLALKRIATVMDSPDIRRGDIAAFDKFSLQIQSLVGMLKTLGTEGEVELKCGSHVARLLSKLPPEQRADFRRCMFNHSGKTYTLHDLAAWLKHESWCQDFDGQLTLGEHREKFEAKPSKRSITILHGTDDKPRSPQGKAKFPSFCPFCDCQDHHLSQCAEITKLTKDQITDWIRTNRRCWRCARPHQAAQCNLKKPCNLCQGRHLQVLHEVNTRPTPLRESPPPAVMQSQSENPTDVLYLDRCTEGGRVLLKVVPVLLHYKGRTLNTYAVLDDGSERTMLLPEAAYHLKLQGTKETLPLRTIRQDIQTLQGSCVSFTISSRAKPNVKYQIRNAFTAARIDLADHSYPIDKLQRKYKHLQGIPIKSFKEAKPLLLIGSDHPQLITPTEPVRLGPPGGPAAIHTRLGWTLQGPSSIIGQLSQTQQCLFLSSPFHVNDLMRNVERLWRADAIPIRSDKVVTRSKEDNQAIALLEAKTVRVKINGIQRYATPLLRRKDMPSLHATPESVMTNLRSVERRLQKDPEKAKIYCTEIEKLVEAGSVVKLSSDKIKSEDEAWYIPHHLVSSNNKHRLVFNCSFQFRGQSLNDSLLPGPNLSPSLLGVLLRFRQQAVAISGDIKGMFHQVHLLPEDRPLMRFVWRDMHPDQPAMVYEWQVLPFGTTCSPCCATFALQHHAKNDSQSNEQLQFSIQRCFYVDNCLQSLSTVAEARELVEKLRALLSSAGFVLRQWASNEPAVISHLPEDLRSTSTELWLEHNDTDCPESTLGLSWHFATDTLGYKHRAIHYGAPTMRNIYKVVASQYDPLGFILPYTTRAKTIIRNLWDKHRGWDDTQLPPELLQQWKTWEEELQFLPTVTLPRPYLPKHSCSPVIKEVHIFCDASEQAYGAVAYMRTVTSDGTIHLAFIMARSRVAPRRLLSIPRLELCAALTGAQLCKVIDNELTLNIDQTVLWSDSTTVLTWLHSESCRFKVFVGTRVAEIQELTHLHTWRYVDSPQNPADDITRGKTLQELSKPTRWSQGPSFLLLEPEQWPTNLASSPTEPPETSELRNSVFCGVSTTAPAENHAYSVHSSWRDLLDATAQELHGAASNNSCPSAETYHQAEMLIFKRAQQDSFPEEYRLLSAGKPIHRNSRLITLAPEFDKSNELIRVGGRLRRSEDLSYNSLHPLVFDPFHPVTSLLIKDFDTRLRHSGPERVFAEIRRCYWILRGREAVRRFQRNCTECRRQRARPIIPKMADLPLARLRLYKPAFYSTGMDCFGPFDVKLGRRTEKRWGIIFKCLTVRAVHVDILTSLDTDSFLMALRRFIARRGTPAELYSDQGTNFKGGKREIQTAFTSMTSELQNLLAPRKIRFQFNPPAAPHFGGVWEREIRSVKTALYTTVGAQPLQEEVFRTVLVEVEAILNSKPLGYVPSDVSDPDPVTPNCLLMGRQDGSLPQVVYPKEELLSRRRWRQSQVLADHFWARFIRLYLPGMQSRQKWHTSCEDVTVGSVAMIVDPQLPRAYWPIGCITKVHPSPDGHVRAADVKVKDRIVTRPVARLVMLPALPEDEGHLS